jgi:hypothetical protein
MKQINDLDSGSRSGGGHVKRNRPVSADADRPTAARASVPAARPARGRAMEATIDAIAELGGDGVRMADVPALAGMSTG